MLDKRFTPEIIQSALDDSTAATKVKSLRPSLADYVAEGVIDSLPEPGPDGKYEAKVRGHDKVVRMLQMNEQANNLDAWNADNRSEKPLQRRKREAVDERRARKFFVAPIRSVVGYGLQGWQYRCTRGHTFGFLRVRPDAEVRTCTRDGCGCKAVRERA